MICVYCGDEVAGNDPMVMKCGHIACKNCLQGKAAFGVGIPVICNTNVKNIPLVSCGLCKKKCDFKQDCKETVIDDEKRAKVVDEMNEEEVKKMMNELDEEIATIKEALNVDIEKFIDDKKNEVMRMCEDMHKEVEKQKNDALKRLNDLMREMRKNEEKRRNALMVAIEECERRKRALENRTLSTAMKQAEDVMKKCKAVECMMDETKNISVSSSIDKLMELKLFDINKKSYSDVETGFTETWCGNAFIDAERMKEEFQRYRLQTALW